MATPAEVQRSVVDLEVVYGVSINGGLFNALKKLTPTEIEVLRRYVGEVFAQGRYAGRVDAEQQKNR